MAELQDVGSPSNTDSSSDSGVCVSGEQAPSRAPPRPTPRQLPSASPTVPASPGSSSLPSHSVHTTEIKKKHNVTFAEWECAVREFCPEGGSGEGEEDRAGEQAGDRAGDGAAEYGALMEQLARMRYCVSSFYLDLMWERFRIDKENCKYKISNVVIFRY